MTTAEEFAKLAILRAAQLAKAQPSFDMAIGTALEAYEKDCHADCGSVLLAIRAPGDDDKMQNAIVDLSGDTLLAFVLLELCDVVDDSQGPGAACATAASALSNASAELDAMAVALGDVAMS